MELHLKLGSFFKKFIEEKKLGNYCKNKSSGPQSYRSFNKLKDRKTERISQIV